MTDRDPTSSDPPDDGGSGGDDASSDGHGSGRKLDEDAAWLEIVGNYGDEPVVEDPPAEQKPRKHEPILEPGWQDRAKQQDGLNTEASWDDEGHFVPPTPPPLPKLEPRRKLAWGGLFGAPTLMLLAVVLGFGYPDWFMLLLVGGFVGGFVYLVATMPNRRGGDWPGDDGAVV